MNKAAKILVVDDESDNRMILESYLREARYAVETARDAEEAWKMMTSVTGNYDIVLLDWMMPGRSGLELLQQIRKNQNLRQIQVIMQTAKGRSEEIQQGLDAGAWYYLTKPFDEKTLLAIVQTALTDRQNYLEIQDSVRRYVYTALQGNRVVIRTLQEARNLAVLMANLCPNPLKMGVGFLEILLNAIEHGNLGITYEEKSNLLAQKTWKTEVNYRLSLLKNRDKVVEIYIEYHATGVSFLIKDQGDGFDWEKYLKLDPSRATHAHGRGIAIANYISFDHLEYRGCGNEVYIFVEGKAAESPMKTRREQSPKSAP